jgi:hypothetical protein
MTTAGGGKRLSARSESGGGGLPPWEECDVFCIRGYGGGTGAVCGWRGAWFQASWDMERRIRVCPQCGETTLLALPAEGASSGPRPAV